MKNRWTEYIISLINKLSSTSIPRIGHELMLQNSYTSNKKKIENSKYLKRVQPKKKNREPKNVIFMAPNLPLLVIILQIPS